MKVKLKIYPISGMSNKSLSLEVKIKEEATVADLLYRAEQVTGNKIPEIGVMVMLNGRVIDTHEGKDTRLKAGDRLWIMPTLCGG